MRAAAAIVLALALTGCAGLRTAWVLHVEYLTPQDKPAPTRPAAGI